MMTVTTRRASLAHSSNGSTNSTTAENNQGVYSNPNPTIPSHTNQEDATFEPFAVTNEHHEPNSSSSSSSQSSSSSTSIVRSRNVNSIENAVQTDTNSSGEERRPMRTATTTIHTNRSMEPTENRHTNLVEQHSNLIHQTNNSLCHFSQPPQNNRPPDDDVNHLLQIRTIQENNHRIIITVSIWISPRMTCQDLSQCIQHAVVVKSPWENELYPSTIATLEDGRRQSRRKRIQSQDTNHMMAKKYAPSYPFSPRSIPGLFRERDDVYIPLSQLLLHPYLLQNETFRVSRLPLTSILQLHSTPLENQSQNISLRQRVQTIFVTYRRWIICISLLLPLFLLIGKIVLPFFLYFEFDIFLDNTMSSVNQYIHTLANIPFQLIERCIDYPLKELYRHGPSIVGWEGASLPRICSQITHMGDEVFWNRNMDVCQRIYETKEKASLQVRRPMVYATLVYLMYVFVRSLVQAWALRYRQPDVNPDMVEIFQAFNMLLRQIKRGMMTAKPRLE